MPTRITNISKRLLIVPLNSGETLHLAPGETSADPLVDYELDNNDKVDKMVSNNLIALATEDDESQFFSTPAAFAEFESPHPAPRKKPASED
jgi:hypothetical protein